MNSRGKLTDHGARPEERDDELVSFWRFYDDPEKAHFELVAAVAGIARVKELFARL